MDKKKLDPIALLEDAYQPAADPRAWLTTQALKIATPIEDLGAGAISYFFEEGDFVPRQVEYQRGPKIDLGSREALESLSAGVAALPQDTIDRLQLVMQQPGIYSFLDVIGEITEQARAPLETGDRPFVDTPAVIIPTGERMVAIVAMYMTHHATFTPSERLMWERIAIHLGAACRLSARAFAGSPTDAPDVEAVVDPAGRVLDARGEATARGARETLRDAVRDVERARTRTGRAQPDHALDLWRALYAGRWSVIEHHDSDGRRFMLARRNDPDRISPLPLTRRQRQIVFYASVGWSLKQIAYALGLSSEGSVSNQLSSALKKLGLSSRAQLVRVTSQWTASLAASRRATPARQSRELTDAERDVAEHVIAGRSNSDIAAARGVSVRTIANQLASIYRKLDLQDRHDLVRWLSSRETA